MCAVSVDVTVQYHTPFVYRNLCDRDHPRWRGKADTLANEAMKTDQH